MRRFRNIIIAAMLTLTIFGLVGIPACKNVCETTVCHNDGLCVGGNCSCPIGWEGAFCDSRTRDRFLGIWMGSDVCASGTYSTTLTIDSSVNYVYALVTNLRDFGTPITIAGTVGSGSTLSFSGSIVGGGRTLSGTMTFSGGASGLTNMRFVYTLTSAEGKAESCTGNYIRQ